MGFGLGGLFGGDDNDAEKEANKAANRASEEEKRRQWRIRSGRNKINEAFSGFDDTFYQGAQDAYSGYYMPQLDRQYGKADERTKLNLASRGLSGSSTAADTLGDLLYQNNTQRTAVADAARGSAQDLRGRVEGQRQTLLGQNQAAADPALAASQAASSAAVLQQPQVYSPLADVFGNFLQNLGVGIAAERQGYRGFNTGYFGGGGGQPSGRGSVGVVNG